MSGKNRESAESIENKIRPNAGMAVGVLVLIVVAFLSWFALKRIEAQTQRSLKNSLQATLNISYEAINGWADNRQDRLAHFVERPDVLQLVRQLLKVSTEKKALAKSAPLKKLRAVIAPRLVKHNELGFFIIDREKVNIGSMRNANLGDTNRLFDHGKYLENIFNGKAQLILPTRSDVSLPGLGGKMSKNEPTMFLGVPVFGSYENVIAAFTIRIDPSKDFTRILRVGRLGESAEIIAFDKAGRMITESRFDGQLREVGLIKKGERAILSLTMRDPGGNLLSGFTPSVSRENLPLTKAVQSAINGNSGVDVSGYRDYRGVPVVGAWMWSTKYGFGMVSEMPIADAYASFYAIRRSIAYLLSFTSLLFIGLAIALIRRNRQSAYSNRRLVSEVEERERINDALLLSEEKITSVLENAVDAIITIDMHGAVQTFNRAAERVFGYSRDTVIGRNVSMLMPSPHRENHDGYLANYNRTGEKRIIGKGREVEGLRKDGTIFPLELSVSVVAHGNVSIFTGIVRDITERKEMEESLRSAKIEAETANNAKSEFLASMSHEIRTPMNAILGMAELLADTELDTEQVEYVETFRRAGSTLLNLINDILDLSKVESGSLELDESIFAIDDLIDKVVSIFTYKAHGKGLEIAYYVSDEVPQCVIGDEARLRQILVNLVGNAIKFTKEGEVVLRVSVDGTDSASPKSPLADGSRITLDDEIRLLFSVTDTGVGIPVEKHAVIFDKFSQADSTTTRDYGGTGLGLAISKRIVAFMDGDLWVESVLGEGSTFSFVARLKRTDASFVEPVESYAESLEGIRTLIIDDNSTNRWIMHAGLRSVGIYADEASTGEEGLGKLRNASAQGESYALLLLDCRMPELDGFGVIDIMGKEAELAGITVLMLTSDARGSDIERIKKSGIAGYLIKPVSRALLLDSVSMALGKSRPLVKDPKVSGIDSAAVTGKEVRPLDLLLVDDSDDNRLLLERFLKNEPYKIDTAVNGKAAVIKFEAKRYDLVLLDIEMPVMDGYTAIGLMRKFERKEGRKPTPVLALTAYALKGDAEKSLAAGFDAHITKPIKRKVLKEMILKYTGEER